MKRPWQIGAPASPQVQRSQVLQVLVQGLVQGLERAQEPQGQEGLQRLQGLLCGLGVLR